MKLTVGKISVSAAALLAFTFVAAATSGARADDFCIVNGAQTAHGCGYSSMEECRAAAAGIGGMCSQSASSQSEPSKDPSDALAYHRKFAHHRKLAYHHRKVLHAQSKPNKNQSSGS